MIYEYKMVQIPPTIEVSAKGQKGNEAAAYLEELANRFAPDGWEFYRVDSVGVATPAGCFAPGQPAKVESYYVVTFRRSR